MAPQKKVLRGFLNGIQDAKLQNFTESEGTLKKSCAASYRLDYQGLNDNEKEHPYIHRLYIQPVGNSKALSKREKKYQDNSAVVACCHASNEATPDQIRDALVKSFKGDEAIVYYAPPKK